MAVHAKKYREGGAGREGAGRRRKREGGTEREVRQEGVREGRQAKRERVRRSRHSHSPNNFVYGVNIFTLLAFGQKEQQQEKQTTTRIATTTTSAEQQQQQ